MKTNVDGPNSERLAFLEAFLILAVFLLLSGRLAGVLTRQSSTSERSDTSFSYFWGRGEEGETGLYLFDGAAPTAGLRPEPLPERVKILLRQQMDINGVSEPLLQTVPGIGPELAARIVRYRTENGNFSSMEELLKVNGIGDRKLQGLQLYLTIADR